MDAHLREGSGIETRIFSVLLQYKEIRLIVAEFRYMRHPRNVLKYISFHCNVHKIIILYTS